MAVGEPIHATGARGAVPLAKSARPTGTAFSYNTHQVDQYTITDSPYHRRISLSLCVRSDSVRVVELHVL